MDLAISTNFTTKNSNRSNAAELGSAFFRDPASDVHEKWKSAHPLFAFLQHLKMCYKL
jgi:hypothetical protein